MDKIPDIIARLIVKKSEFYDQLIIVNDEKCSIPPEPALLVVPTEGLKPLDMISLLT